MKTYKLKISYPAFVDALLASYAKVIAPIKEPEENGKKNPKPLRFGSIKSSSEMPMPETYINTVRPAKEFLFPQSETIVEFKYKNKDISINDPVPSSEEQIIIGLRPCDAAAFGITDDIFGYVYKDEFYLKRRENTTLICVACEKADEACFCNTLGLSNTSVSGSDIFLIKDKNDNYLAQICTEKGEIILQENPGIFEEISSEPELKGIYKETADKLRDPLNTENISARLQEKFNNEKWDTYAARCLACGSCAYLCPTCHCFDIVDENRYEKGYRRKNWDACQFPSFTLHASGHNPRDVQSKRYRQRVMHKFSYYSDRFDKILCTGCGRCIRSCPVNIDIYSVVKEIANES